MSKRKSREEYLEDARIDDRLVKHIDANTRVVLSEGKEGEERITRIIEGNGTVYHYTGGKGAEALERVEAFAETSGNKRVCHYKGAKDEEVLWLVEHSNGNVTHYEGPRHQEYKTHVVFSTGNILYFKGPRKKERKLKQVDKDGSVTLFKGEQHAEYYWSVMHPTGEYHLFTGAKGQEKLWRVIEPSGTIVEYEGTREHPVRRCAWHADGQFVHFTDDNPLVAIKESHADLKSIINESLERVEQLNAAGDCKENCYLVMSEQIGKIHTAASSLYAAAKINQRHDDPSAEDDSHLQWGESGDETSESEG